MVSEISASYISYNLLYKTTLMSNIGTTMGIHQKDGTCYQHSHCISKLRISDSNNFSIYSDDNYFLVWFAIIKQGKTITDCTMMTLTSPIAWLCELRGDMSRWNSLCHPNVSSGGSPAFCLFISTRNFSPILFFCHSEYIIFWLTSSVCCVIVSIHVSI